MCVLPLSLEQAQGLSAKSDFQVFWGGPDRPARLLRNLLEEKIHAVPSGGEILWVTYYFRDVGLADALIKASLRGVKVRLVIEGDPRTGAVNSQVLKLLQSSEAIGQIGVRALKHRWIDNRFLRRCRLHEKLYYFSHPVANVLVGTFNPSGNVPEDQEVIDKIGDQDRGHNVLVDIKCADIVKHLYSHANHIFRACHGPWERFLSKNNRVFCSGKTRVLFFPRSQWAVFNKLFESLTPDCTLRMAVSHLNDRQFCKRLLLLAFQGVRIEMLVHDTERRVPQWTEKMLLHDNINFHRYVHPESLPMHNKFMLFEMPERRILSFGSLNLSVRSLHANHELLVIDETPELYEAFRNRWDDMLQEVIIPQ